MYNTVTLHSGIQRKLNGTISCELYFLPKEDLLILTVMQLAARVTLV